MPISRNLAIIIFLCVCQTVALANTSNSQLAVSPDGNRLLVVNIDNDTVTVVDTKEQKALREIKVGDRPECVTWIGDSDLAAVTCYYDDAVVFFNAKTGQIVKKLAVMDEPYGIVANKAGTKLWVTNEYPGMVTEIDAAKQSVTQVMPCGDFVRGIALSPNEKRLYVTEFHSGILKAVDPASGKVVDSWKGHSTDNLCRSVVINPKETKAYLSHIRSMIRVINGGGSIFPHLSICDLKKDDGTRRRTSFAMDTYNGVYVVTNSWEADISPDGSRIYTIYAGTNDMNISKVLDDGYKEIERIGGPVRLGTNPRAIRVSPDGEKVYVYNALDFAVTVHDADMRKLATIKVCEPPKTPEWVRGKILFNTANYPMSGRRWVSCSSCHPDGHHDARTWHNPEGLRNTTALFGMAHTHPLHWSGDRDEAQDFEYTIRSPLMQGPGLFRGRIKPKVGFEKAELGQKLTGLSKDLDALALYCNSLDFPLSPHAAGKGKLTPAAEEGKKLFFSEKVGCAKCHSGPYYSDSLTKSPYNLHDVGTGKDDPSEKMGTKYDTPSLLWIYRSAPYLHDGKAATLHDVLTKCNKDDKHGKTSHLSPQEIDNLVEFLKSLPYDTPPAMTPNTVENVLQATSAKE